MTKENEKWKQIEGFNDYFVSSEGRILSKRLGKSIFLKPALDNPGYLKVNLGRNNTRNIHRLVAEAFLPNPDSLRDVNHKDGNKLNNNIENLEWISHSGNIKHSYEKLGRKRNNWTLKPVLCVEKNKKFKSVREASAWCGLSGSTISNQIAKRTKTAGGYHWRFL